MYKTEDYKADLSMNSQPLWYCFRFSWGIQTLSVSGRYTVDSKNFIDNNWKYYRIMSSLNNAEITTKKLFSILKILFFRRKLIFNQLKYRINKLKE